MRLVCTPLRTTSRVAAGSTICVDTGEVMDWCGKKAQGGAGTSVVLGLPVPLHVPVALALFAWIVEVTT